MKPEQPAIEFHVPMRTEQPSIKLQQAASALNALFTSLGMVSLGLLAMLLTHHSLESKGFATAVIGIIDAITFLTNIMGKIAIVLYFNAPVFTELFNQLYQNGIKSFFTIPKRTFLQHLGKGLNYLLSLNASLFWAGMVQISFIKSAAVLDEFNSTTAHAAARQIRQWYIYTTFLVCSFYANWISWPGIHQAGYDQKKSLLQWLFERPAYRWQKTSVAFKLEQAHQKLLDELKAVINTKSADRESKPTPRIDALVDALNKQKESESLPSTLTGKLEYITQADRSPQQWREAYLQTRQENSPTISTWEWGIRHACAVLFTLIGIWGFRNVLGLCDTIWAKWAAPMISTYGARYAALYSMAEVIMLIVYPMIYGLVGILKHGIPSHAFSKLKLGFILALVLMVGICSSLANAEQSDLDHEAIFEIGIAGIAAFLTDSFGIYMVSRRFFESRIADSEKLDKTTVLGQKYLDLRKKGQKVIDISGLHGKAVEELAESCDLTNQNPKHGSSISLDSLREGTDETAPLLTGKKFRMFSFGEKFFRSFFSIEEESNNKLSLQ